MACSHTTRCELFAQFALNPALRIWQQHYCDGEYTRCARYQMSLKGEAVPLNLLPNGQRITAPRNEAAYGAVALFNAITKDRIAMVESLLRTNVDINVRSQDGTTPLMAAVLLGNQKMVELLINKGADVAAQNAEGKTAASIAAQRGHEAIATMLRNYRYQPQVTAAASRKNSWLKSLLSK